MTPETLRKLAEHNDARGETLSDQGWLSAASWREGRASAFREVAAALEAEECRLARAESVMREIADPERKYYSPGAHAGWAGEKCRTYFREVGSV